MSPSSLSFELPGWVEGALPRPDRSFAGDAERMELAVGLARSNVRRGTGGPFGAAVFDREDGRLVAPGVNLVVEGRCSVLHAEIVALALAQRRLGTHDLAAAGGGGYELVATAEPCAMCYGALPWSGVSRLVCGARGEDVGELGFDEGDKPTGWVDSLERRGVEVERDVRRDACRDVLRAYADAGGPIYNSRRGETTRGD